MGKEKYWFLAIDGFCNCVWWVVDIDLYNFLYSWRLHLLRVKSIVMLLLHQFCSLFILSLLLFNYKYLLIIYIYHLIVAFPLQFNPSLISYLQKKSVDFTIWLSTKLCILDTWSSVQNGTVVAFMRVIIQLACWLVRRLHKLPAQWVFENLMFDSS